MTTDYESGGITEGIRKETLQFEIAPHGIALGKTSVLLSGPAQLESFRLTQIRRPFWIRRG